MRIFTIYKLTTPCINMGQISNNEEIFLSFKLYNYVSSNKKVKILKRKKENINIYTLRWMKLFLENIIRYEVV